MGGDDEIGCSDMHGHKMLDSSHDAVTSVRELGRRPFRVAYDDGEGPDYHVKDPVVPVSYTHLTLPTKRIV